MSTMAARKPRKYNPRKPLTPQRLGLADQWVAIYGETVTKAQAARMIGVCRRTIYAYTEAGLFRPAAGSRLLTRSIAEYIERAGKEQA